MRPLILVLFLTLAFSSLRAQQDSVYAYYDSIWEKLDDKNDAAFFRVVKDLPDGKYLVRDYYSSGNLQFVGTCSAVEPTLLIEGNATLYHENGATCEIGRFENESRVGLHKYWYEDGTKHKEVFHKEDRSEIYHQFWSREGEAKLAKGKGLVVEILPGRQHQYLEIEDSVVVASFSDDQTIGSPVFTQLEQRPEYSGGYNELVNAIKRTMKYPRIARRLGIEGTVYVSFVVAKDGTVSNGRVLRGIHEACDAEALRAAMTLNKWKPGIYKGEPVFVRFVLPIKFTLN